MRTEMEAIELLENKLAEFAGLPAEAFYQGDEIGKPLDTFFPVSRTEKVASELHFTYFLASEFTRSWSMREMMHSFEDVDRNFVQQFQSTGFDARIWELTCSVFSLSLDMGLIAASKLPIFIVKGLWESSQLKQVQ
jgi:hypothetical protein